MATDIFPTAKQSRFKSRSTSVIFDETTDVMSKVITASEDGSLSVEIQDTYMTTPGTIAEEYWLVWKNINRDDVLQDQMNCVVRNLNDKGYSVNRKTNPVTDNTFIWVIRW